MKIIKYFLGVLLLLIVGLVAFALFQPNSFDVQRTKVVNAPLAVSYDYVNNYRTWEDWGPWHEEDSSIVVTYPEKTSGLGASYTWTSKDGPGSMETIEANPMQSITQIMKMEGFEPTTITWNFKETEGKTTITWGMKANKIPFLFKLISGLNGGMDNMLGGMLEKGLKNIDAQLQKKAKSSFKLGEMQVTTMNEQFFSGYRQQTSTDMDMETMTGLYEEFLPKAIEQIAPKSQGEFVPGTVFTKWDEETKTAEFLIGAFTPKKIETEGMEQVHLPAGKILKVTKYGPYGQGDYEAHTAIANYMQENDLKKKGNIIWETYPNDPEKVAPESIETVIQYPVE